MSVQRIAELRIPRRRNEYGEYHCYAYLADGTRYPDADYFTDDFDDAASTAVAVAAEFNDKGPWG